MWVVEGWWANQLHCPSQLEFRVSCFMLQVSCLQTRLRQPKGAKSLVTQINFYIIAFNLIFEVGQTLFLVLIVFSCPMHWLSFQRS